MLDDINYESLFNDSVESIPKSMKGDFNSIHEIKISKNKLYIPKNTKETLIDFTPKNVDTIKDSQDKDNSEMEKIKLNKYKYCISTVQNNLIYFPDNGNFYTNDKDLKQLIDLFNEPNTKDFGYTNVIDEDNCKVYKRMVEGFPVILISVFSELKVVNHEGENGAEILFMIVKSPVFFISNRDFVQQRKMWKNFPTEKSHILHFISVENHECPPSKKNVRAETIISGYYMQDDPDNPEKSILGVLSQTDLKGNIPHVLVNKFAPKSSKNWVKSLIKGCEIVTKNH